MHKATAEKATKRMRQSTSEEKPILGEGLGIEMRCTLCKEMKSRETTREDDDLRCDKATAP